MDNGQKLVKNKLNISGYIQLLRIHHYIKNLLVFIPLFFSANILNPRYALPALAGFVAFSLLSSVVYIINDIRDRDKDRLHSVKRLRPLASGRVSLRGAFGVIAALIFALLVLSFLGYSCGLQMAFPVLLMALYLVLNIAYSLGLKNIPLVDISILAAGYVIRVLFGATLIGIDISVWLYLMITLGAFYLGLGKRRNEKANENDTREVMRFYSHNFLDKNMYMCQALCIVFYALWSIDAVTIRKFNTTAFVYTIPLVLLILLKYSLNIEANSDGDPTSVILLDKVLLILCAVYAVCVFFIIYINRIMV
jgi:4-hydroxybenzoate polyprenyltransferase